MRGAGVWAVVAVVGVGVVAGGEPLRPFTEEAIARGISYVVVGDDQTLGKGLALVDLDGDGDADLVAVGDAGGRVGVWENDGSGVFTDRSGSSGIAARPSWSGVSAADYDGDGDLDLFLTRYLDSDVLLRNDGGFVFTDVTASAGVGGVARAPGFPGTAGGAGLSSCWADVDLDGDLDLFVANRTFTEGSPSPDLLFRNRGDGTFEEVGVSSGASLGGNPTLVAAFADYDLDGDADLYIGNDKGEVGGWQNHLLRNAGGAFTDVTEQTGTQAWVHCMGIAYGDYDGNGLPDFYATNIPRGNVMLLQVPGGRFVEGSRYTRTALYRFGWAAMFLDFDNDTNLDLYVCNVNEPNAMLSHFGAWPGADVAGQLGVDDAARTYCVASADIDLDGDTDMVVSAGDGNLRVFINREGERRGWARLRIAGTGMNRDAVGALVFVTVAGRTMPFEVRAGHNYKSQNEHALTVGLGDAAVMERVEVRWPGGPTRILEGLAGNRAWVIDPG